MKPRHAGLAAAALGLAFAALAGCKGGRTVPAILLDIDFDVPLSAVDGPEFCRPARSVVIAFDEVDETAGPVIWEHTLLLDSASNLYGCGADRGPCASNVLQREFDQAPLRVLVEWLDVSPAEYFMTNRRSNVVCRGMYDEAGRMGQLSTREVGAQTRVTIEVPLLRVGDVTQFHSLNANINEQPLGKFIAMSPMVQPTDLAAVFGTSRRDPNGGYVLAAGGLVSTNGMNTVQHHIYQFEPGRLGFYERTTDLLEPRYAATATAFLDSADEPTVLFAGGIDANGFATRTTTLSRDTGSVAGPDLLTPRGHHSAIRARSPILEHATVVLMGGCDGNGAASRADLEFLVFGAELAACTPSNGGLRFCKLPAQVPMGPARCQAAATTVVSSAGVIGWISGGSFSPDFPATTAHDIGDTLTGFGNDSGPGMPRGAAVLVPPGPAYELDHVVTGGISSKINLAVAVASSASILVIDGDALPFAPLRVPRGFASGSILGDETMVVTGGQGNGVNDDDNRTDTMQFLTASDQKFGFLPKLGFEQECDVDLGGSGCVRLHEARAAHSTARIEGTTTWINGALLIVGGSPSALPEIYVPAYQCDEETGTAPVLVRSGDGEEYELHIPVDFCDRGLAAREIDDPSVKGGL